MATGKRGGRGLKDRNVGESAGIRPYKLDLVYADEASFLAAKSARNESSSSAEEGDFFYDSTTNSLKVHNGTQWEEYLSASSMTGDGSLSAAGALTVSDLTISGEASGELLQHDGSGWESVPMSGDATIASGGALTISADAVSEAEIADTAGVGALGAMKYALAVYDFAVDGGAVSTIALADSATIPDNAVCELVGYDVITTCTSATDAGTMLLTLPTDGALSTAIAISDGSNPFDAGAQLASALTPLANKTTAARALSVTIATEAFTAGKIVFCVRYWVSQ